MTKRFDWKPGGAGWVAEMPGNVTLVAMPDRVRDFGMRPARGTVWRAQASHWDETTRTISRYGRDEYGVGHKTWREAQRAAEAIYTDAEEVQK